MKIILLQNIKSLGKIGDIKDVAEGYAQNFLFPKKLAEVATEEAVKNAELQKEQVKKAAEENLKKIRELAEKLKNRKISLKSKAKNGKLFGSISAKNIAEALQKENLEISEKSVMLNEAIKKVGEYKIKIELDFGIKTEINLEIAGA